jgi:uncharacterized protein YuzE
MKFDFEYDFEDDILSIHSLEHQPSETVEFSEFLNIDANKEGNIVGLELLDASTFFGALNKGLDKNFLNSLTEVHLEEKEHRNTWFIVIILKSGNKTISQPLPPIRKSEYASPLLVSS